ncbi:MAG TPA: biotin/lipoyl-containing protein [Gemmatimonadales bacterium]|jgi:biotin carboxyl carrier protein|nr:biotin/lipoyl-containing protein [Gemmatimonadales bacterium]
MKYQVTVGAQRFEIEIDGDQVTVDGVECRAELQPIPGTPLRQLLLDRRAWTFAMEQADRGSWKIVAGGDRFEVAVMDQRTAQLRSLAAAVAPPAGAAVLRAPMPGLVLGVLVEAGQSVAAGQSLVVLEAMKMQNVLKAAGPGVVERVSVRPGATVERGEPLITFGPAHLT